MPLRELNRRTNYGTTVVLLWNPTDDSIFIDLETESKSHRFPVPHESANDAFQHPYVYLPAAQPVAS